MQLNSTSIEITDPVAVTATLHGSDAATPGPERAERSNPRSTTLAFIRQFARCYQPQLDLPFPLSEVMAN